LVERSFGWMARDYRRLTDTLAGLHDVALICLMLGKTVSLFATG
jgi:hypothetical protein